MASSGWILIVIGIAGCFLFASSGGFDYVGDVVTDLSESYIYPGQNPEQTLNVQTIPRQTLTKTSDYATIAKTIANAIEPRNAAVRTYALDTIKRTHSGDYNIGQICDIYDALASDWVYVSDPADTDYFATATESVATLKGDCDDYAILMASLIESIGGTARVICVYTPSDTGHAYAEVYLSDSKTELDTLLNSIFHRYPDLNGVHYHEDNNGGYWLNLDWSSAHPGGEFYQENGTALIVMSNGEYETVSYSS